MIPVKVLSPLFSFFLGSIQSTNTMKLPLLLLTTTLLLLAIPSAADCQSEFDAFNACTAANCAGEGTQCSEENLAKFENNGDGLDFQQGNTIEQLQQLACNTLQVSTCAIAACCSTCSDLGAAYYACEATVNDLGCTNPGLAACTGGTGGTGGDGSGVHGYRLAHAALLATVGLFLAVL